MGESVKTRVAIVLLSNPGVAGGAHSTFSNDAPVSSTPGTQPLPPRELEFWLERAAFEMIPTTELAKYEGQYVASRGGRLVASDPTLAGLTEKFFSHYDDVPVYMTKIGHEEPERIDTPFVE